ncbi:Sensor histidine kinase TodS [compost metagenome]
MEDAVRSHLERELEAARHALAHQTERERRAWAIFDSAAIGMALVGLDGRFLRTNRAWERIVGYAEAELLARRFQDITHPDDLEADLALVRQVLAGEIETYQLEKRYFHKLGHQVIVRLSVSLVRDGQGAPLHFVSQIEDISEERHAQEALRESERKFRAVFEQTFQFMGLLTTDGRVLAVNQTALRAAGVSRPDALIGRSFWETPWWDFSPEVQAELKEAIHEASRGKVVRRKVRNRTARRGVIEVDFSLKPIQDETGRVLWLLPEGRDLSEVEAAEMELARRLAELHQAQELTRLKDQFLSTISHEMKTPLSLILGYAELIEERCDQQELVAGIIDGGQRLTAHLNDILDYSALVTGSLPLYKTEVSLNEVIAQAAAFVEREAQLKDLTLDVAIAADLPPLSGDSRRLGQMVIALLDNACKASPPGGRLGLVAHAGRGGVQIEVWDSGAGLAPEDEARLWEPFNRLGLGGGLGLGLSIVKMLAELHGGTLSLAHPSCEGNRFLLQLPCDDPRCCPP